MPLPWQRTVVIHQTKTPKSNATVSHGGVKKPVLALAAQVTGNIYQQQLQIHDRATAQTNAPWDGVKILTTFAGCDNISGTANTVLSPILSPTMRDDIYGLPNPGSVLPGEDMVNITANTGGNSYIGGVIRKTAIQNAYVSGVNTDPKGALNNKPYGTYAFTQGGSNYAATGKASRIVKAPQLGVRTDGTTIGVNSQNQLTVIANPGALPGAGGYKAGAAGSTGILPGLGIKMTPPPPPTTGPTSNPTAGTALGVGTYQTALAYVFTGGTQPYSALSPIGTAATTQANQAISNSIPAAPSNLDPRITGYALFRTRLNGQGTGATVVTPSSAPTAVVSGGTTSTTTYEVGNTVQYAWVTANGESPLSTATTLPSLTLLNQFWSITTPAAPTGQGIVALNLYMTVATANLSSSDGLPHLVGTYNATVSNTFTLSPQDGAIVARPVYPYLVGGTTNATGNNPGAFYLVTNSIPLTGGTYVDTVADSSLGIIAPTITEKVEVALADKTVAWAGNYPSGFKGVGLTVQGPRSSSQAQANYDAAAVKLAMHYDGSAWQNISALGINLGDSLDSLGLVLNTCSGLTIDPTGKGLSVAIDGTTITKNAQCQLQAVNATTTTVTPPTGGNPSGGSGSGGNGTGGGSVGTGGSSGGTTGTPVPPASGPPTQPVTPAPVGGSNPGSANACIPGYDNTGASAVAIANKGVQTPTRLNPSGNIPYQQDAFDIVGTDYAYFYSKQGDPMAVMEWDDYSLGTMWLQGYASASGSDTMVVTPNLNPVGSNFQNTGPALLTIDTNGTWHSPAGAGVSVGLTGWFGLLWDRCRGQWRLFYGRSATEMTEMVVSGFPGPFNATLPPTADATWAIGTGGATPSSGYPFRGSVTNLTQATGVPSGITIHWLDGTTYTGTPATGPTIPAPATTPQTTAPTPPAAATPMATVAANMGLEGNIYASPASQIMGGWSTPQVFAATPPINNFGFGPPLPGLPTVYRTMTVDGLGYWVSTVPQYTSSQPTQAAPGWTVIGR